MYSNKSFVPFLIAIILVNQYILNFFLSRYHVEDEQKYGHLIPGRISSQLRYALGLKRNELPLHIYQMRKLGYPPGWLEEARISHSGISMFDSAVCVILKCILIFYCFFFNACINHQS